MGELNVTQAGSTAAPPGLRQLRRCIGWRDTITDQLKSLAAALLALQLSGDCHGLNIAIDLILTSVNAMVSGDDFVDFIANLEKFYWLIGVTKEIKSPCGCRGFGWLGYHWPSPFPSGL